MSVFQYTKMTSLRMCLLPPSQAASPGAGAVGQTTVRHMKGDPIFKYSKTHCILSITSTSVFPVYCYIIQNGYNDRPMDIEGDNSVFYQEKTALILLPPLEIR